MLITTKDNVTLLEKNFSDLELGKAGTELFSHCPLAEPVASLKIDLRKAKEVRYEFI